MGILAVAASYAVAQSNSTAVYLVAEFEVTDPVGYQKFGAAVGPIIASHGGKFVSSRGQITAGLGEVPKGVTIIRFESLAKGQAYVQSPENAALGPLRDQSSKGRRTYFVGAGNAPQ